MKRFRIFKQYTIHRENKKDEMYHDCWIHLISGYMQTTGEAAEGK